MKKYIHKIMSKKKWEYNKPQKKFKGNLELLEQLK